MMPISDCMLATWLMMSRVRVSRMVNSYSSDLMELIISTNASTANM